MTELWRYEKDIGIAWPDETSAVTNGNDILKILNCTTVDEFFQLAQNANGFSGENENLFPEIHDSSSEKHESFRQFVERSLNTENVTRWGQ